MSRLAWARGHWPWSLAPSWPTGGLRRTAGSSPDSSSAGSATAQLVFLPTIAHLATGPGWRWAAGLVALVALLLAPIVWLVMRDRPADVGLQPYGAGPDYQAPTAQTTGSAARLAVSALVGSLRSWPFWALMITFWVCGWSTNGLIATHFISAAHDHGMPPTTSAGLLALIGIFDIVGTVASGWLTDRVDSRLLLAGYYFFRGIALLVVPSVLGPTVEPPLFFFVVFYGLDWVATVPPTVALCRQHFGLQRSGVVFGWVFASHMVGAGVAASYAGIIRESLGDYYWAWITAGAMCVVAALICLTIPRTARLNEPIADELGKETAQI
ncbi:MAG: MFS transporter [Marmoricola sp.]